MQRDFYKRLQEIFAAFGKLGLISFGGPIAHLGYFHSEFVDRRRWISESDYADLVALCQFLPGPASSQVAFALGLQRAGLLGGFLASMCFTLPSAALMIAFAYGTLDASVPSDAGWLHGLRLAAVVVVSQAVWGMGKRLCPDGRRATLCIFSAALALLLPFPYTQVIIIAVGAAFGVGIYKTDALPVNQMNPQKSLSHVFAFGSLAIFFMLLLGLPIFVALKPSRHLAYFDSFYRTGSLVFGGGHVVLPLLRQEIVPKGWLSDKLFLVGYGAAQAMPGPLFAFSAYLGAAMEPGKSAWLTGLWCLLGIFLPSWLLVCAALPFWQTLRATKLAQGAIRGANAAVVGLLLAALYNPIFIETVHNSRDMSAVLIGFLLLQYWKLPPWTAVLSMIALGMLCNMSSN